MNRSQLFIIHTNLILKLITSVLIQGMRQEFGSAGSVCSIEESSGPQNLRVQKVMSQRSTGLCTRCIRANAFPAQQQQQQHKYQQQIFTKIIAVSDERYSKNSNCLLICCLLLTLLPTLHFCLKNCHRTMLGIPDDQGYEV